MPVNNSAYRRYKVIDMLLRNKMKPFPTMDDLIDACWEKVQVKTTLETIQKDIARMRMSPPDGFDAPIYFDRKHLGYAYRDPNFTLTGINLNQSEIDSIKESIDLLNSLGGTRVKVKLKNAMEKVLSAVLEEYNTENVKTPVIQTHLPPPSRGYEHVDLLYHACRDRVPVSFIHYQFKKRKFSTVLFHPFCIKEFENRWFVIGHSEKEGRTKTFGLDSIYSPVLLKRKFIQTNANEVQSALKDYYGVTLINDENITVQEIEIEADADTTYQFQAYPIHESQEIRKNENGSSIIRFRLIPTEELIRLFLSYGKQISVKKPLALKKHIQQLK
jgi:predicted DNA-binding transcriptional regulator YafY